MIRTMKFKPHQKCWSVENGKIKEHTIQDIGFTFAGKQLIKINDQWHEPKKFYATREKATDVEEGLSFKMFR